MLQVIEEREEVIMRFWGAWGGYVKKVVMGRLQELLSELTSGTSLNELLCFMSPSLMRCCYCISLFHSNFSLRGAKSHFHLGAWVWRRYQKNKVVTLLHCSFSITRIFLTFKVGDLLSLSLLTHFCPAYRVQPAWPWEAIQVWLRVIAVYAAAFCILLNFLESGPFLKGSLW